MDIGKEESLGIENGVEIFSKVINHYEIHEKFVRLSDNKDIFRYKTIYRYILIEYYDPDFWTIEVNGEGVPYIPNFVNPVRMVTTLGDRLIRITTKFPFIDLSYGSGLNNDLRIKTQSP